MNASALRQSLYFLTVTILLLLSIYSFTHGLEPRLAVVGTILSGGLVWFAFSMLLISGTRYVIGIWALNTVAILSLIAFVVVFLAATAWLLAMGKSSGGYPWGLFVPVLVTVVTPTLFVIAPIGAVCQLAIFFAMMTYYLAGRKLGIRP